MTLLCLKPSPYSRRVVWSLALLGDAFHYNTEYFSSIVGEPALRWRLGRWSLWEKVTVPVAFISDSKKELVLENGIEIVEWANEHQSSSKTSLMPPTQRSEIIDYCRLADDFQNFDRSMFLKALAKDAPSILRGVVGDGPPDIMLRIIGFVVGTFMRTKYQSTMQASTEEIQTKALKLEKELAAKQQQYKNGLVYLVGAQLTAADIFMSVAICGGVKDRSKKLTEHQITMEESKFSQGFSMEEKYPTLYQWAVDISEKHKVDYSLFEE